MMRKFLICLFIFMLTSILADDVQAQCSICTKTAQQLGEKPARGLNAGILYLAFSPLIIGGVIGYRWWRNNRDT